MLHTLTCWGSLFQKPKRLGSCYTLCMPTVLRFGGLRVVVYLNDHRPEHVHVIGHGHEAVFELSGRNQIVTLRENYGFMRRDLAAIQRELLQNLAMLLAEWERLHGAE
jgi:hypothetical protein